MAGEMGEKQRGGSRTHGEDHIPGPGPGLSPLPQAGLAVLSHRSYAVCGHHRHIDLPEHSHSKLRTSGLAYIRGQHTHQCAFCAVSHFKTCVVIGKVRYSTWLSDQHV